MQTRLSRYTTLSAAAMLCIAASQASATVLVRNDFSRVNVAYDGSIGNTNADGSPVVPAQIANGGRFDAPWQDFSGIEGGAGQSYAWARNIGDAYDADNNPATANVAIRGGIEINGWDQNYPGVLRISLTTPEDIQAGGAVISFWAAFRQSVTGGQVQIRDITGNVDLLAPTTIADGGIVTDEAGTWDYRKEWKFNQFAITQGVAAGHDLQVIFTSGTAVGDAGLELTDLTFQSVPEPASMGVIVLAAAALARRRPQ